MCLAVQSGDIESVCHILAECEEQAGDDDQERLVDLRNQQSHAPLHLACTAGNLYVLLCNYSRSMHKVSMYVIVIDWLTSNYGL